MTTQPATADQAAASDRPSADPGSEGIWPSKRLLRSILTRRADEFATQHGFDDEQRAKTRQVLVDGWSEFLAERRDRLQPLLNEFLEMRLDVDVPTKERVQAWADRVGPLLDELSERSNRSLDELRPIVKPEQRIGFEAEVARVSAALAIARARLDRWRGNDFDPTELWEPPSNERRSERRTTKDTAAAQARDEPLPAGSPVSPVASRDASREADDPIESELRIWDRYVADFGDRGRFTAAQRDAARSCLVELKARAIAHRDRHAAAIAELERRIAASRGSDEEVEAVRRDVVTLYGPVDDMFAELERRIETIPTTEQREAMQGQDGAGRVDRERP